MAKYKLKESDFERQGGIAKLERDGFSREVIFKTMYNMTPGVDQRKREDLISNLYDRREKC